MYSYEKYVHNAKKDKLKEGMKVTFRERVCVEGNPNAISFVEDIIDDVLGFTDSIKVKSGKLVHIDSITSFENV